MYVKGPKTNGTHRTSTHQKQIAYMCGFAYSCMAFGVSDHTILLALVIVSVHERPNKWLCECYMRRIRLSRGIRALKCVHTEHQTIDQKLKHIVALWLCGMCVKEATFKMQRRRKIKKITRPMCCCLFFRSFSCFHTFKHTRKIHICIANVFHSLRFFISLFFSFAKFWSQSQYIPYTFVTICIESVCRNHTFFYNNSNMNVWMRASPLVDKF